MAERYDFYVHDNRKITFNLTEPIMREDSGVTDFVFHIPKILNELEVSDWAWWFVFVNAKKEKYSIALTLSDDPESPLEKNVATYTVDYAMSIKAGSVQFALEAINTGTGGAIDGEWHTLTYETKVKETLQGNQAEYAETESDVISALLIEVRNKVNQLVGGATPTPAQYKAQMTDPQKVYLYIGSEPNEHAGHWYYHNGATFVSGGVYGAGVTDAVPTQGSANAVSSGGVYDALQSAGLSEDAKVALLACFEHVAWSTPNGDSYYQALATALNGGSFQPYIFNFGDADNRIGGIKPSGSDDYAIVHYNTLNNRASIATLIPFSEGTITARSGYKITAYKITNRDVQFRYTVNNGQIDNMCCGVYLGVDTQSDPYPFPEWVDSVTIIPSDNCHFVWVAFKKTSDADWTPTEIESAWDTVYTSSAVLPTLSDILTITSRRSLKPFVIGTLNNTTKFKIDSSDELATRARTNFLPLTKGRIESADNSKYQVCMYQVDDYGFYIQDSQNPIQSDGFPAWSDSFTIHSGIGVLVAFKKLDGTDFTQQELSNAYGTIFNYVAEG